MFNSPFFTSNFFKAPFWLHAGATPVVTVCIEFRAVFAPRVSFKTVTVPRIAFKPVIVPG